MTQKLYVLGIGPGDENFITPAVRQIIEDSDVLIGGKRNLAIFSHLKKEEVVVGNNLEDIRQYIEGDSARKTDPSGKKLAVLVSGDPGLFSMLEFLKRTLPDMELEVFPGISSLQVLSARLGLNWDDLVIKSVHGREQRDLITTIRNNSKVALFTGGEQSPASICSLLVDNGLGAVSVSVGENLSYEKERIVRGTPGEISKMSFESLSIMIIENKIEKQNIAWEYVTQGIPDDRFIRGEVPMTKEEIRAVTLSKLRLTGNEIVYDIGAGTGSVAVECALSCKTGRVYAIEKEEDALELIRKNIDSFKLDNVVIITGKAPYIDEILPAPDRVFIGGSSGKMEEIIQWVGSKGNFVRIVINTIALESTVEALSTLEKEGFDNIEIINLSVSRGRLVGGKHMMQAINPVYIISAEKNSCWGRTGSFDER